MPSFVKRAGWNGQRVSWLLVPRLLLNCTWVEWGRSLRRTATPLDAAVGTDRVQQRACKTGGREGRYYLAKLLR